MYNGFAQNKAQQWNVGIYDESFSPEHPMPTWNTYILKTTGDTIINNLNYKKLNKSHDSSFMSLSYVGGIRIDTGKVFINVNNSQGDILLYDYNLKEHDTATIFRIDHSEFHPILVTIDSIDEKSLNNKMLKRFYVSYSVHNKNSQDIWIENIGSIKHGLLNESCFGATGCYTTFNLLCYKEDDVLLLQNKDFNTCFKETIINSIKDESSIEYSIYPSLVTNKNEITVESRSLMNQIQIFNNQGRLVYFKNIHSFRHIVDLNNFSNGLYIIVVDKGTTKLLIAR